MRVYINLTLTFDISLVIWAGMMLLLHFRFLAKQREYLDQCPPEQGIPLTDMLLGYGPLSSLNPELWRVMLHHQTTSELEQLRRATWRSFGLVALWSGGFPLCVVAIVALMGVSGLVHYR